MSHHLPDLSAQRAKFPALQEVDDQGRPYVYFDGPGGTQVPQTVIEAMAAFPLEGRRILLARAAVARDILPRALAAHGAHVDVVEAYRTVLPTDAVDPEVQQRLARGDIAVITFTSSSTVTNFAALMGDIDLPQLLRHVVVACIGPVTAQTARDLGLTVTVEAEEYTVPGLVRAMESYFQKAGQA